MIAVLLLLSYLGNVSSSNVLEISILVVLCEIQNQSLAGNNVVLFCHMPGFREALFRGANFRVLTGRLRYISIF